MHCMTRLAGSGAKHRSGGEGGNGYDALSLDEELAAGSGAAAALDLAPLDSSGGAGECLCGCALGAYGTLNAS